MLRRLSYIGREDAVLKDLEQNLPDNLQSLYQLMLAECRKNRTEAQYKALKRLFAWLAFSKRPLTLSEATALVKITVPDGSFDLEDEIIGRSARYYTIQLTCSFLAVLLFADLLDSDFWTSQDHTMRRERQTRMGRALIVINHMKKQILMFLTMAVPS